MSDAGYVYRGVTVRRESKIVSGKAQDKWTATVMSAEGKPTTALADSRTMVERQIDELLRAAG